MRYCKNCGGPLTKKDKKCPTCGWDFKTPIQNPIGGFYHRSNGIIFSTLAITTAFLPGVGIILGGIGIYMGIRDYDKKVWILGIIGTALSVLSLVIWIIYGNKF